MAISMIKTGKKKGHFRVRIQPVDELTGKCVSIPSKVTQTKQRSEATKIEYQMWREYKENKLEQNNKLEQPFAIVFNQFVEDSYSRGRWEESTYYDWAYTAKLIKKYFGKQKVSEIREGDIDQFAHDYVRSHHTSVAKHSTVDRQLQNIRSFFIRMQRYGLNINPVPKGALNEFFRKGDMTLPSAKYVFSCKEVNSLKTEIYKEIYHTPFIYWGSRLAILIALDTGMRPQEIQALMWKSFTKEDNHIVFNINDSWSERSKKLNGHLKARYKGQSRNTLPISQQLFDLLKDYHVKQRMLLERKSISNNNDFVLLNLTDYSRCQSGMPIAQRTMNDMLKRLCNKIKVNNHGLRISMYTCRHTVATKLGNTPGMIYPWAAARLGHSLQMFMRTYVHPDNDKTASMFRLLSVVDHPQS